MIAYLKEAIHTLRRYLTLVTYKYVHQRPFSIGYYEHRNRQIEQSLQDDSLAEVFASAKPLPKNYGAKLDERIVEYPWVLSQIQPSAEYILDAGSTLNQSFILKHPTFKARKLVIYNLAPESMTKSPNVSYIFGDLRNTILKDNLFDWITCISVLEHIGMNNTLIYTNDLNHSHIRTDAFLEAISEFKRLLKPDGSLLMTVPYGQYQNLGWLQQFNKNHLEQIIHTFQPSQSEITYYRYTKEGWVLSQELACQSAKYNNVHDKTSYDPQGALAAEAIACLRLVK